MAATDIKNDALLGADLVSAWLSDSSGLTSDLHGSNTLTNNNTVTLTTGKQGDAGDFERTNLEWLEIDDASQSGLDLSGALSIACWFKIETSASDNMVLVAKWDNSTPANQQYILQYQDQTPRIQWAAYDGTNYRVHTYNINLTDGTDYHLVLTQSSAGTTNMYLNGSSVGSTGGTAITSIQDTGQEFQIGARQSGGTDEMFWDGVINQVLVYSKELTSTNVGDLYNSGSGIPFDAGGTAPPTRTLLGVGA